MKVISVSGVIGWDVLAADIREALSEANGDDLEIQVSSPGGLVYEGLEIHNLIKKYPGNKTTRLMGLAASMASYIVLAGDTVIAEDNAVYMIHNARGIGFGDHNSMKKTAGILEGLSNIFAKAYSRKSGKEIEEIKAMMDEETFLYGEEILDAGFVDEMEPAGDGPEGKEEAISIAIMQIDNCEQKLKEIEDEEKTEKAVAMITGELQESKPALPDTTKPAAEAEKTKEVESMENITLEILMKDHPSVYAEAVRVGQEKGIADERARRNALAAISKADPDNEALKAIVEEAIEDGTAENNVAFQTKVNVAIRDGQKMEGENAPAFQTTEGYEDLTEEDMQAAKMANMSLEDYVKYSKKEAK